MLFVDERESEVIMEKIILTKAVSLQGVKSITSFSRATIYRKIQTENFPKPIKISAKRVVWDESQVKNWLQEKANSYIQ